MSQLPGIGWFAREVLHRPLYWYQEQTGDAIIQSVLTGQGATFTVMMARQMGKNQLSAVLEAYLLFCMEQGTIVKAAPTYKPQVINSRQRLLAMCEAPLLRERIWKSFGYIIGCAPESGNLEEQRGPRILFFSAGPESHIVGATASLLLEIDEAQDVAAEKYDIELKPMASTTHATTVMYGTAWSDSTLLARQRVHNLELEESDGLCDSCICNAAVSALQCSKRVFALHLMGICNASEHFAVQQHVEQNHFNAAANEIHKLISYGRNVSAFHSLLSR